MTLLATEAIVLHAFDYLESSRILRVVTRDGGVRSALAKGARRSSRRFGSGLDLFAQGHAQLYTKPGRDLDTLGGFDVVRSRPELGADLDRFSGAAAIAELTLRFGRDAGDAALFEAVSSALDAISAASGPEAPATTLANAWRIVAELGVAPTVDNCAECHAPLAEDEVVVFSHRSGGSLCRRCGLLAPGGRKLPAEARAILRAAIGGDALPILDALSLKAHQRLLREFLAEHLADGRPLRAFELWESQEW